MTSSLSATSLDGNASLFLTSDTEDFLLSILNPSRVYNLVSYGGDSTGVQDSTPAATAIVAAIVASGKPGDIYAPAGEYMFQDPDTGSYPASSAGPIRIPSNCPPVRIHAPSATFKVGPNGISTALIRIFAPNCRVDWVSIDQNVTVALNTKANVGVQVLGSLSPGVDGCNTTLNHVRVYNGLGAFESYTTGNVSYDHTGGSSERLVTLSGGTFPAWVIAGTRIKVGGNWFDIETRVDGTKVTLTAASNPGTDVGSAAYEAAAEPLKNAGRDGIQLLGVYDCVVEGCNLNRVGWNGIRVSGSRNKLVNNTCTDQRGNGLRIMDNEILWVDGFTCYSQYCSGRCCVISDAGSSADDTPADNLDVRCQYLYMQRLDLYCTTDGRFEGAGNACKLAATRITRVEHSWIRAGIQTNNVSLRIEDCCSELHCHDVDFYGRVIFTPNIFQGIPTTFASNGAGTPMLNITLPSGHGLVSGKSFFVYKGNSAQDNKEHVVNSVATNVITTNTPYISSAVGSNIWAHAIVDTCRFMNCTFRRSSADGQLAFIENFYAYNGEIVQCDFFFEGNWADNPAVKQRGVLFNYTSDRGCNKLRLVGNTFSFTSSALCKAFDMGIDQLKTGGKVICYGNTTVNRRGGTTVLVSTHNADDSDPNYASNRAILFATAGEDVMTMYASAIPTGSDITFLTGQKIWYTGPSAAAAPGAVCTTGGAVGTWKTMAVLAS